MNYFIIVLCFCSSVFAGEVTKSERESIDKQAFEFMKSSGWRGFPYDKYQIKLKLSGGSKETRKVVSFPRYKLYHDKDFKKVALEFVKWEKGDSPANHPDMLDCPTKDIAYENSDYYINFLNKYKKSICIFRRRPEISGLGMGNEQLHQDMYAELFDFYVDLGTTLLVDFINSEIAVINIKGKNYYLKVSDLNIKTITPPTERIVKKLYGDNLFKKENTIYEIRKALLSKDRSKIKSIFETSDVFYNDFSKASESKYWVNGILDSIFVKNKSVMNQSIAMLLYITYFSAYRFDEFVFNGSLDLNKVDSFYSKLKSQNRVSLSAPYLFNSDDRMPFLGKKEERFKFFNDVNYLRQGVILRMHLYRDENKMIEIEYSGDN